MDNAAFEMHEAAAPKVSYMGKMNTISVMEKKRQWSLMSVFLVCLLACTITTAVGALILSLVYISSQPHSEPKPQTTLATLQKAVDPKFQYKRC